MNTQLLQRNPTVLPALDRRPTHRVAVAPPRPASPQEREFTLMQAAFARHGGFAGGDEVATLLRRHADQPISALARWIVAGDALWVVWQSAILLPLFQFDLERGVLRKNVHDTVLALRDACDDWELALWFALGHPCLADEAPVDLIADAPGRVLDAARADRFMRRG